MSKLSILDLDLCELVTEEDPHLTGGFVFPEWLRSFEPNLEGYTITEISSDPKSRLFKLEKPGIRGYKLETGDGKSKSSYLILFGDNPGNLKTTINTVSMSA